MSCISCLPNTTVNRIFNEKPGGLFDCINLTFTTLFKFDPETVVIRLDGNTLDPSQYSLGGDNQSFTLIIDSEDAKALSEAPRDDECLRVDYNRSPETNCITIL